MAKITSAPAIFKSDEDIPYLANYFRTWNILVNIQEAKKQIEEASALKNNGNVNKDIFDIYFEYIESAITNFLSSSCEEGP